MTRAPLSERIRGASIEKWDYIPGGWADEVAALENSLVTVRGKVESLLTQSLALDKAIEADKDYSKTKKLLRHKQEQGAQAALSDVLSILEAL